MTYELSANGFVVFYIEVAEGDFYALVAQAEDFMLAQVESGAIPEDAIFTLAFNGENIPSSEW